MFWRRWATYIDMMRSRARKSFRQRSVYGFISSIVDR